MKAISTSLLSIIIISSFLFTSCKKQYTCACDTSIGTAYRNIKAKNRTDAHSICAEMVDGPAIFKVSTIACRLN